MTDYKWKSCSDPVNVERLKTLLEAGQEVIIQTIPGHVYSSKTRPIYWLDKLADGGRDNWQFLEPNPWRYPSCKELPPKRGFYLCTVHEYFSPKRRCQIMRWTGSRWLTESFVDAWQELPEPAGD